MAIPSTTQANGMATTAPQAVADNNPLATSQGNAKALANGTAVDTGGNKILGFGTPPTQSTTTLSNTAKINQVPTIQSTTNNLANNGISTNSSGTPVYANGTIVPQPQPAPETPTSPSSDLSKPGISQGGYFGETYYAPGAVLPTLNGQPVSLTATSPTQDTIFNGLNNQLAQSDAVTASIVQNITNQYSQLVELQKQANAGQEAGVTTALMKGNILGQGTQAQYNPFSDNLIHAQVSYGLQQIADLQNKENQAITAAQQAGVQQKFQIQDKLNAEISKIRDEKVAAANKLNDQIAAQNQKLADAKIQQAKDSFIAQEMQNGVTDPQQILQNAKNAGVSLTASEIGTTIKALTPVDSAAISNIAAEAAKAGADAATVAKIGKSTNIDDALALATPALGAKTANDLKQQAFDNQIKLQQTKLESARVAIEQQNANINLAKLQLDQSNAAQAALNAKVTTPSGKIFIDGSNLDTAAKAAALKAGQVVLDGESAKSMNAIMNVQGQVTGLLSSLQAAGVVDANGNFTGKGQTAGFWRMWQAGSATPSVRNFNTNLTEMVKDLQKLPGTGELVATLQNNIPKDTDSQSDLKTKITNISSVLESSENSLLANSSAPPEGTTGTINGQTATFTKGQWVTK